MAIAKMEKRSATVWSGPSAVHAGIGAALCLISLLFLWLAFKSFMVRTNYVEAVYRHDSNRRQEVRSKAEKAVSWGSHAESRELLAKALVEANQLDAAEKEYTDMASGSRQAMGLVGQGIVLIRRADAEKDLKKSAELARKAKDRFADAKAADAGLTEAQIGAATADLVVGLKLGDEAKINSARSEFLKIHKALIASEDQAAQVTREGYIDLFVGLARSHASEAKFSPEALSFAGSARRYLPASSGLYAMELALQSQQMVDSPPTAPEIRAAKTYEKLNLLKQRIITGNAKAMDAVADAWFSLTLSAAAALARGGDYEASREMVRLAQRGIPGDEAVFAAVLEASLALEATESAVQEWNKRQSNYGMAYVQFRKVNDMKEMQEPARAGLRATMLNNQAFFEEDTAAQGGGEPRYQHAVTLLLKALEAEEQAGIAGGSYEVRRNLAVIQKRRGKPDAADHYAAAEQAAANRTDERIRRDLEELRKYFSN